jgi:hypothetical protein
MPEVFKVKNYFVSNTNITDDIRCKIEEEDLNNNEQYHILLNPDKDCLVFGDIDHCESTGEVMDILRDIIEQFDIENNQISFTHSIKTVDGKDDHGSHWVIPLMCSNMKSLKQFMENTIQKKYGKIKIDTGIYKKSWFRLPNQTNEIKTNIHTIKKGEPIDFLVQYKNNLKKCKWTIPEITINEEVKRPTDSNPTEETDLNKLSNMVFKIMDIKINYYESYNEWINLMFIIYNESNGSCEGLTIFDDISSKIKGYNKEDLRKRWYQHKPKASEKKLTIKSIYKTFYELYPEEREKASKEKMKEKFTNNKCLTMKQKFEKHVFKLKNPICFGIEDERGIQLVDSQKLGVWAKGDYMIEEEDEKGKIKSVPYSKIWEEDPEKRVYDYMDFEPDLEKVKDVKMYNTFKGFKHDDAEPCDENSPFLLHLKRLSNDKMVYEYIKQWIAHIIQKPYKKTNTAIVLYSETKGSGKNDLILGIEKIITSDLVAEINCIDDVVNNFNSNICNKLLVYGDEITAKAQAVNDKLKASITRETLNLEHKGKDKVRIKDCNNYIFTTNNRDAFKIEKGDRRMFMVHCIEEKMTNHDEYTSYINDKDEINKLFKYFKEYTITYKIGDTPPETEYKKMLSLEDKPSYYKYIFLKSERLQGYKYKTNEIYTMIKEWAKINHFNSSFTINIFSMFMNKVFKDYKINPHNVSMYDFEKVDENQFNKILYEFDKDYYMYINDLSEPPDFNRVQEPRTIRSNNNPLDHNINL